MGLTQNLGRLSPSIFSDASLNIGVGAAPSGSYKFEVTGTSKVSGVLTLGSTLSNGTYTYTLPAATGTLALTSDIPDLSGYVTLATNQTITGLKNFDLGINIKHGIFPLTLGYTGIGAQTNGLIINVTGGGFGVAHQLLFSTTNPPYTYTFPSADGTLALTSNLSSYLPLTGGTLTGALNGTSASFSGTGRFIGALTIGTDFAQLLPISAANYQLLVGSYYDGTNIIATATSGSRTVYNVGGIDFRTFTGATVGSSVTDTSRLTIASTGAATFSSNLTTNGYLIVGQDGTAGYKYVSVTPSSTSTPVNIQGVHTGIGAYAISLNASGGNVLIGTSTDNGTSSLLQLGGSGNNKLSLTGGATQNGMRFESVATANTFYLFNGNYGPGPGWGIYNVDTTGLPFWIQNSGAATFSSTVATTGIVFPNSQVPSANANTLDDYEEGIWTPIIACSSGGASYTAQLGWYTKIGRVVTITWFLGFTKGSLSGGTVRLTNFPFNLLDGSAFYPQGTVLFDNLSTVTNNITLQGANNSNSGDFIGGNGGTTDHVGLPTTTLGSGTMACRGTLTYFTS